MTSADSVRYRAVAGLERTLLPDGCAVYDRGRREIHYLNPAATAILALCGTANDRESIAEALQGLFNLPAAPSEDVDACIDTLAEKGLIEIQIDPSGRTDRT
ncbi:PqqD family protein [Labrys sp. LIt4]|uniref:PqqD family protein n=1 Tax=Labrys sp. LIt4 TaxID=2821355 RepID=UPI001AE0C453|nr:PqqD family protein [Labrys sp. LIt4]MBP0581880.1 PqqD family protein [Labrys sp. LIt4]